MHQLSIHLWYDKEAKEAAQLYTSLFPDSKIASTSSLEDTPSGTVDIVNITLAGQDFTLLSAGPLFKFNPSISFMVTCSNKEEVNKLWKGLSAGGQVLMELAQYPFSEWYGWCQDKYGLSWQIGLFDQPAKQKITPTFLFVGDVCGKAEEAINFYTSIFHHSKIGFIDRYEAGQGPDKPDTVRHADFTLESQHFAAMDSALKHDFAFNEAISIMVHCKDQAEVDYYWEKLSAVPESEQCGWLKDQYGVSWQIMPDDMDEMMRKGTKKQIAAVTESFLKMKKFDIAELKRVYDAAA